VAGASTSQNATSVSGRCRSSTASSSSASNTPTPLAFTTRSAPRARSTSPQRTRLVGGVDHDLGPRRVGHVAVALPIERVGLEEGDAVAAACSARMMPR
jgi:hypothetical protein